MTNARQSYNPVPLAEELYRDYVVCFLAEMMQRTGTPDNQTDFQAALQAFCDSLRPWMEPCDEPSHLRATFTLLDGCVFDETGENISVVLSPEAKALFRAWLRRNKIWSDNGLHTAHAWSN